MASTAPAASRGGVHRARAVSMRALRGVMHHRSWCPVFPPSTRRGPLATPATCQAGLWTLAGRRRWCRRRCAPASADRPRLSSLPPFAALWTGLPWRPAPCRRSDRHAAGSAAALPPARWHGRAPLPCRATWRLVPGGWFGWRMPPIPRLPVGSATQQQRLRAVLAHAPAGAEWTRAAHGREGPQRLGLPGPLPTPAGGLGACATRRPCVRHAPPRWESALARSVSVGGVRAYAGTKSGSSSWASVKGHIAGRYWPRCNACI